MSATLPGTQPPATLEPLEIAQARDEQEAFLETHGVNPFVDTGVDHLSTFSMDVDTASYTIVNSDGELLGADGFLKPRTGMKTRL